MQFGLGVWSWAHLSLQTQSMTSPLDEETRLAILHRYAVLDTARICEAPIALVSLLDADRQWFKSTVGWDVKETPRPSALGLHILERTELLIVPDAACDARFANHPFVIGEPGMRFYAGMPLISPEGATLGLFCVMDRVARALTSAQADALEILGRQVMAQFELRRQSRERSEGERLLRTSENKVRAIFDAESGCLKLLESGGTLQQMNAAGLRLIEAETLDSMGCEKSWRRWLAVSDARWNTGLWA